jgi:hypothetical protein
VVSIAVHVYQAILEGGGPGTCSCVWQEEDPAKKQNYAGLNLTDRLRDDKRRNASRLPL